MAHGTKTWDVPNLASLCIEEVADRSCAALGFAAFWANRSGTNTANLDLPALVEGGGICTGPDKHSAGRARGETGRDSDIRIIAASHVEALHTAEQRIGPLRQMLHQWCANLGLGVRRSNEFAAALAG